MRHKYFRIVDRRNNEHLMTAHINFFPNIDFHNLKNHLDYYQNTGLLDIEGKEIYESDIVEANFEYEGEMYTINQIVAWADGGFVLVAVKDEPYFNLILTPKTIEQMKIKVIGTTYENPELAEGI